MLDYAANGTAYWTVDSIRASFESNCISQEKDPDQEIRDRLGESVDPSKFWTQVKTNLEAQKLRLLFVADVIPRELKRIVEFLNRQMNPSEVLALELKQFSGENGLRTLAPTLFGQTEEARVQKSASGGREWNEELFFQELDKNQVSLQVVEVVKQIYAWLQKHAHHPIFGKGRTEGSITGYFAVGTQHN